MKKISFLTLITALPVITMAQNHAGEPLIDQSFLNGLASILALYIGLTFIVKIISQIQDNRLKSKMIEKGVSEQMVEQILRPTGSDTKEQIIKWVFILFGIGCGAAILHYTQPLGFHSIAFMCFSVGLSLLGYLFFIKRIK
ncbi:hypothetical protein [Chitinophaga tropicalis]|uniref:Uncharacterized protein n=1 Tax=Chitinophaga tropicalis TaxID=2683588 RepID=A0A7K1UCY8_9BACT|nr:hypothetical protein [Chitinophaga tropicalis]MVT12241.1 hypothetical protein [Chitinophaga tropicalis]